VSQRIEATFARRGASVQASRRGPISRVLVAVAAAVVGAGLLSGCFATSIDAPSGAAPLRYRDAVFSTYTKSADLPYGSAPDLNNNPVTLRLDLYQPSADTVTQRPAVVLVHGGGFAGGDKSWPPSSDLAPYFAKRGYVTVSINYRLMAPNGCGGSAITNECFSAAFSAIHDAQAAVRWLRANASTYGIDTNRIAIGGDSAGGVTSTGVAILAGDPGTSGNPGPASNVRAFMSISGGVPGGVLVDSASAPGILFSGTSDVVVPYQWSVDTAKALDAHGVKAVLETFQGAGHVPWQFASTIESQTSNFFYKYLDLAHAPQ
jgi:acetyl esterase/lipase